MKTTIEALAVVWPTSIPRADYEKALRLAGVMAAERPAVPHKPKNPHVKHRQVSPQVVERVRQLLQTGAASSRELSEATGLHFTSIYDAFHQLGAVPLRKELRKGPSGHSRATVLYGLPQTRTP